MADFIKEHDFMILIYKQADYDKYSAAIKALNEVRKESEWDRILGVTIHKDCRIPEIYHGNDLAIIMERDKGRGNYSVRIM